jgi:Flp pilus assembly protein TadG
MRARLSPLAQSRHGGAAAEFALVLPVVAGMILGALDFSHAWTTRLALEQAAQAGIELVAARKGVASSYTYALAEAQTRWGKPLTSSTVDSWLECGGVKQSSLTSSCGTTQRARYVSIRLTAQYVPMMNLDALLGGAGTVTVVGDAAVRVQ